VLEAQEESWLMTYLDVITLLLVMMVVMLSLAGPPNGETTAEAESPPPDPVAAAQKPTQVSPDIVPPVPLPVAVPAATDPLAGLPLEQLGKDIEVVKSDTGVRFRISSEILFSSGAASLAQGGLAVLDTLLPVLNAQPELRLVVEGHTDDVAHTNRAVSVQLGTVNRPSRERGPVFD
jgi:chemotaxis protein MotB